MAFATPQELSQYTKGEVSPTDDRAAIVLDGATLAIRNYCGWNIATKEDFDLELDGGSDVLYLPTLKLNSVAQLTVSGTLVQPTDYEWSRVTGNLRLKGDRVFPDVWGGVRVTFNSGYNEVPADLKQVVLQAASAALSSPSGATKEQAGGIAMTWATTAPGVAGGLSLLARDLAIVDRYRIQRAA